MIVILGKAKATSKNDEYSKGEIHAVLMFVNKKNNNKAQKIAKNKMKKMHWKKIKMSRIGTVSLDKFNPDNEGIKSAFDSAMKTGFGVMVYPEVEKDLNL